MQKSADTKTAAALGVFFFILDQLLKYAARSAPFSRHYMVERLLGWEYFENPGIAFGIYIPAGITIVLTPLILVGLLAWFAHKKIKTKLFVYGIFLVAGGALSNLVDRILFGATIDYLRIWTALINLGDCAIVAGIALLLWDGYTAEAD